MQIACDGLMFGYQITNKGMIMKYFIFTLVLIFSSFNYQYWCEQPDYFIAFERFYFGILSVLMYVLFDKYVWAAK